MQKAKGKMQKWEATVMRFFPLAMTSESLMNVILIVQAVEMLVLPFVGWTVKSAIDRLSKGDQKFEAHGKQLAVIVEKLETKEKSDKAMSEKIERLVSQNTEARLEGNGAAGELRVEMERHFVRKVDLERIEERLSNENQQILKEIRGQK
jgi:Txe/YoeB family toxin of Txe-Axe toxin-antitoxin module